jgi:hypothetical protein
VRELEKVKCRYCILAYYNREINDILWHAVDIMGEFINSHGGPVNFLSGRSEISIDEWKSLIRRIFEEVVTPLSDLYANIGKYPEFSIIRVAIELVIDGFRSPRDLYNSYRKLRRYAELLDQDIGVYTRKCLGVELKDHEEVMALDMIYETAKKVCGKSLHEAMYEVL